MKRIGLLITFLAFLGFVLPSLSALEEKKDPNKAEKKDADKKDEKKDPDKKDPEKKDDEKKKVEVKKDKLVYGAKFVTRIKNVKPDSNREFTIETQERDLKKVADVQTWAAQRQQQLAQQYAQAANQKDFKARATALQNWQRDSGNFQAEMAKKNVFSSKDLEVRASETAKVRTLVPPIEFDEVGVEKKWTKKELEERRDKTGLPGFAVDFDAVRPGQLVEIYMVKQAAIKKVDPKKKGPNDDDPSAMKDRPEFVLIVIMNAGK